MKTVMLRLRRAFALFSGVCALATAALPAAAAGRAPCAKTAIASIRPPTGPAQYESGTLTLANGASMRLQGEKPELYRARQMHVGDPVAACYGPAKGYADAPTSRTITVLDLANGSYYGNAIGNWKQ